MRNFLLFALVLFLGTSYAWADDIEEDDLVGTWEVESAEGTFDYTSWMLNGLSPACLASITFYTEAEHKEEPESLGIVRYKTPEEYTYQLGIQDYFLTYRGSTGGYNLHLQLSGGHTVVRYIVTYSESDMLELTTFDKKGKLVLVRQSTTSAPSVVVEKPSEPAIYYNLNGQRLPTEPNGGVYIVDGKKYTVRKP